MIFIALALALCLTGMAYARMWNVDWVRLLHVTAVIALFNADCPIPMLDLRSTLSTFDRRSESSTRKRYGPNVAIKFVSHGPNDMASGACLQRCDSTV